MKLTLHTDGNAHIVRAYTTGELRLRDRIVTAPVLLSPTQIIEEWAPGPIDELLEEHLAPLLAWQPDVCILGTGERQTFPPAPLLAALARRGTGLEVMNTAAACRTYNVLVSDGRNVAAALVV